MGRKIDWAKVMALKTTPCPKCGYQILPNEILRINNSQMQCPKCKVIFITAGAGR